ncbi:MULTISPECIES: tetratricopeptide repeat protein [unclassified Tenacibaculum]|uniref:tetratricopeptide repeat protein n=1 Tax=unclassified Tenacibaculum TaxID=2635139 RepID=UPI001F26E493|nr:MULTISPECIES: tetratricopeptide repeat protein [unclassified Tenacibaculum]MCF2875298.1 tetratricopeptide repeat protein [Tenacibaculum sp. Cn5-1]MCF2935374.1 tetratricopeptide repeat protein [Tenacibaculum sp. Cn5-34]MCG7511934.1 tetratricopeptide repeat protein [Tenacibaculum sp. Cn5-46]
MKKSLIILLFSISTLAQSKGDILRDKGSLEEAIDAYKLSLKKDSDNYNDTYNLACAYALLYKKDSAFHYLNKALKKSNSLWCLADNDFLPLTKDERWDEIEEMQMAKYQKEKLKLKNPEYAKQLLRLIMKDQSLDYQLDMAKRYYMKNGKAPHWYYPIAEMKKELTEGNFAAMEKLISENGWPSYSMVGKLAADGPLLIINHHEKESVRIKYLPKIKQACLDGEGSCVEYAKIQDRILVNTGKLQLYGMQFRYNKERKLEPFPLQNPNNVDERRKKIGLEPLKKYLKRKINYDWKVN